MVYALIGLKEDNKQELIKHIYGSKTDAVNAIDNLPQEEKTKYKDFIVEETEPFQM